jgi:hypothetical protein
MTDLALSRSFALPETLTYHLDLYRVNITPLLLSPSHYHTAHLLASSDSGAAPKLRFTKSPCASRLLIRGLVYPIGLRRRYGREELTNVSNAC